MRTAAAIFLFLLLASPALAQSRYNDRKRRFSFPVPAGWTQVSEVDLEEDYEEPNEGIEGKPTTLAAWEKNPSRSTSAPILLLRWRRLRHHEATAAYEKLKTGGKAALDEIVAEQQITKHYKLGKVTFDEEAASVRIPHGFESMHGEDTKILIVRFLGQYSLVWLEFRGPKSSFVSSTKEIEATVAGFEFEKRYRVNYEPEPPPPPPPPVPATDPNENSSGSSPFDTQERGSDLPVSPGVIFAIVAVLVGIGVLALVVLKLGGGNRPPPRRRGGGGYRRR